MRFVTKCVRKEPGKSAVKFTVELSERNEISVSASTVRRVLNSNGYHGHIPRKKPLITKKKIALKDCSLQSYM